MMFTIRMPITSWNESTKDNGLTLGQRFVDPTSGNVYEYVLFDSTVTIGQGLVRTGGSAAGAVVKSGTTVTDAVLLAGLAIGSQTATYYGWMLVSGVGSVSVDGTNNIAIGQELGFWSTEGSFRAANATGDSGGKIFARAAYATDATITTISGDIHCL